MGRPRKAIPKNDGGFPELRFRIPEMKDEELKRAAATLCISRTAFAKRAIFLEVRRTLQGATE